LIGELFELHLLQPFPEFIFANFARGGDANFETTGAFEQPVQAWHGVLALVERVEAAEEGDGARHSKKSYQEGADEWDQVVIHHL